MAATRVVSREALEMLAAFLDVTADDLIICRDLIKKGTAYYQWQVDKPSGGKRTITSPTEELKAVQRAILVRLLYQITVHFVAHGFQRARDIMTNAACHKDARTILNLDLRDAFPSVRTERVIANLAKPVRRILRLQFGDHINSHQIDNIVWMVTKLCTFEDCLPQGAPTSPALLNVVCLNLDQNLYEIARRNRLTLTRYADDITFSTKDDEIPGPVRQEIRYTISRCGWKANDKKTKYLTRSTGNSLEVTGLVLQPNGKLTVPTERRERYKQYFTELLAQDSLSESDRARAISIVVYCARVYNGYLPSALTKPWLRVKSKFGIQDAPRATERPSVDMYVPEF